MRHLVLALAIFASALHASQTAAQPCADPAHSSVPPGIILVGTNAGAVDTSFPFTVHVADVQGRPVAGTPVSIVFNPSGSSLTNPDVGVCIVQSEAGLSFDCITDVATKATNASGNVTFYIVGGSKNTGNCTPGGGMKDIAVVACGVQLGLANCAILDQDGVSGVSANDLSLWLADFFCQQHGQPYVARSDYDFSGMIGANDLSIWLGAKFGGQSISSCASNELCFP
jgi:hypothetical protein